GAGSGGTTEKPGVTASQIDKDGNRTTMPSSRTGQEFTDLRQQQQKTLDWATNGAQMVGYGGAAAKDRAKYLDTVAQGAKGAITRLNDQERANWTAAAQKIPT